MTDTFETLCVEAVTDPERVRRWARAHPSDVHAVAEVLLARMEGGPPCPPNLVERKVLGVALCADGPPASDRWDRFLPFVWGADADNAALAAALGPDRTVAALLSLLPDMYDVHAVRLALSMLPGHPDPRLVRLTLAILGKRGFGAQYPKAKVENARLRGLLDELGARVPAIAAAIAAGPAPKAKPAPRPRKKAPT